MIPQNKNVHQLAWHVDPAVEGSEIYCYNTEGDSNSVASQESCRWMVTTWVTGRNRHGRNGSSIRF